MSNRLRAVEGLAAATGSDRLVEGWVEGPCAEAADLRGIIHLMLDFYDDPAFVRELVDFTVELGDRVRPGAGRRPERRSSASATPPRL